MPWNDHPAWAGSNRRQRLPINWPALRVMVLERDGRICWICGKPGADQVDHVLPVSRGGSDHPNNLAPVHAHPCHAAKSAREGSAAANRKRWARDSTRRPPEPHPGLM
jgi:5-methylcytosine-specific restriction protein A